MRSDYAIARGIEERRRDIQRAEIERDVGLELAYESKRLRVLQGREGYNAHSELPCGRS
jgi:hypothetical protein